MSALADALLEQVEQLLRRIVREELERAKLAEPPAEYLTIAAAE